MPAHDRGQYDLVSIDEVSDRYGEILLTRFGVLGSRGTSLKSN